MAEVKKNKNYLTNREIKAIARANAKEIKRLEAFKNRKAAEEEFLSEMKDDANILEIEDLHTSFFTEQGVVRAVNGVSYNVPKNAVVGIVGESGCGKSVTSMSVMRLIQGPTGQIVSGSIRFKSHERLLDDRGRPVMNENGEYEMVDKVYDIAKMPIREIHRIRGKQVAMIFQEPMTSLNPVFTIGQQLDEVTLIHVPGATKEMAKEKSCEMLRLVGIIPENVYGAFPHELSGGMRQRVMIAMALAAEPRLIIADEPTTALDVTIQAQILELINVIKKERNLSVIFITHNMGVVANMADRIAVMYAGKIVEHGTSEEIFYEPAHPYTWALLSSMPDLHTTEKLESIPGTPPNMIYPPKGDAFAARNKYALDIDFEVEPPLFDVSPTHQAATWLLHPNAPKVEMPQLIKARIERMKKERE